MRSQGPDLESEVDPRFGRCSYFVIVDLDDDESPEALPNNAADSAHGAGTQAAQLVGTRGVEAVLTRNVGPSPVRALGAAGIAIYVGIRLGGRCNRKLPAGRTRPGLRPTVGSHHGLRGNQR